MNGPATLREVEVAIVRGGTSRGVLLRMADVAAAGADRDRQAGLLIGADVVDGLGGGAPVTDKVVLVGPSTEDGVDLDYIVGNVGAAGVVDWSGTCGNMTSGVVPYGIATGLAERRTGSAPYVLRNLATGRLVEVTLAGAASVPSDGAEVAMRTTYVDPGGSVLGSTLPTGRATDVVEVAGERYHYSLVDVTHPYLFLHHEQVVGDGEPSAAAARIEEIRGQVCVALGLCATAEEAASASVAVPRVVLVRATPPADTDVRVTAISMGQAIGSVPVTAGLAIAAARALGGTVLGDQAGSGDLEVVVAGPQGTLQVQVALADDGTVRRAAVDRTARILLRGRTWLP